MKIDRLIGILSVLLQREKITSYEFAEKFEISHRTPTFYKYIMTFEDKAEIVLPEKYRHEFTELINKLFLKYKENDNEKK